MAMLIIDRRKLSKHKSAVNRQRFLRRYRKHIKKAVADAINKRSITDIEHGEEISIPKRDVNEPNFHHGRGGRQHRVLPGNKEFITGDKIKRPNGRGAGGSGKGKASNTGEGLDEFIFELTQEEFMDFMFEDLELPNLLRKQLKDIDSYKIIKGGYTKEGIPARLNVLQSLRGAQARRIALGGQMRKRISFLNNELEEINESENDLNEATEHRVKTIAEELDLLKRRLNNIPFLDDFDLMYNNVITQPIPTTSAVMFCIMDVSGSMTQEIKDIAKRFFLLLYLFLKRNYNKIEVVFIRHHTQASEVDEQEFFYSRETGGTIVSSALKLTKKIINKRYSSSDWNIYAAQASDGDNWQDDSSNCSNLLMKSILPHLQYYAYVEIKSSTPQALWHTYETVKQKFPELFDMQQLNSHEDIYPVFHNLFKKRNHEKQ